MRWPPPAAGFAESRAGAPGRDGATAGVCSLPVSWTSWSACFASASDSGADREYVVLVGCAGAPPATASGTWTGLLHSLEREDSPTRSGNGRVGSATAQASGQHLHRRIALRLSRRLLGEPVRPDQHHCKDKEGTQKCRSTCHARLAASPMPCVVPRVARSASHQLCYRHKMPPCDEAHPRTPLRHTGCCYRRDTIGAKRSTCRSRHRYQRYGSFGPATGRFLPLRQRQVGRHDTDSLRSRVRYGTFATLRDRAQEAVRGIVEGEAAKPAARGSIGQKVGDFYKSFMDEGRVESLGVQPLAGELKTIDAISSRAGSAGRVRPRRARWRARALHSRRGRRIRATRMSTPC